MNELWEDVELTLQDFFESLDVVAREHGLNSAEWIQHLTQINFINEYEVWIEESWESAEPHVGLFIGPGPEPAMLHASAD